MADGPSSWTARQTLSYIGVLFVHSRSLTSRLGQAPPPTGWGVACGARRGRGDPDLNQYGRSTIMKRAGAVRPDDARLDTPPAPAGAGRVEVGRRASHGCPGLEST